MTASLRERGPDWRLGLLLAASVVLVWLGGARPVLAATVRTENGGTGWSSSFCASSSGAEHSGGTYWYCTNGTVDFTFTVAAGDTAVLKIGAPQRTSGGNSGITWSLDSGAQTGSFSSYSASNTAQVVVVTTATIAAGTHTIRFTNASGAYLFLDYADVESTTIPTTTTTTTVPPTTTTTLLPTTTTLLPTTTTTLPPTTTTTTCPGVPCSLSSDAEALPVSSMLAIGGLVGGLVSGSVLTRMVRP